jgi:hypothetical protein
MHSTAILILSPKKKISHLPIHLTFHNSRLQGQKTSVGLFHNLHSTAALPNTTTPSPDITPFFFVNGQSQE